MMKQYLFVLILILPFYLYAQLDSGIVFKKEFSWNELLKKAKDENKLVFMDCYASWCGPCKRMDREVFVTKEVGDFFNKNFICTRLQMDKTNKDEEIIKKNYDLVGKIEKNFKVNKYPSYLFIDHDGKLVHKATGYTSGKQFIEMAEMIKKPGYTYKDPYKKYDSLIMLYRQGKKLYNEMPYMIETAKEFGNSSLTDSLNADFYTYLKSLKKKQLLKKENIEFLTINIKHIDDPFIKMYTKYKSEINAIMKDSLYCRYSLDGIIHVSVIDSVLTTFYKTVSFDSAKNKGVEPSWNAIYKIVHMNFEPGFEDRAIRAAKVSYFRSISEYKKVAKIVDIQIKEKDLKLSDIQITAWVNDDAWRIFLFEEDKETIMLAISWMNFIVKNLPKPLPSWMDTYANLLYKASLLGYIDKRNEALATEKDAAYSAQQLSITSKSDFWKDQSKEYHETFNKMQKGVETWHN